MEGNSVRGLGSRPLLEGRGIEHEQERAVRLDIEHHRQEDALVFGGGRRGGNEDRLAGIDPLLVPARRAARLDVDLEDRVEEVARCVDAGPPYIAIRLAGRVS
jgi:hypothetical protein